MKTGDLVAIRFDDDMVLGIITGWTHGEHTFIYASGKTIITNNLPRTRFVQVRVRDGAPSFTSLCMVDWDSIEGQTPADRTKLRKWIAKQMDADQMAAKKLAE